MTLTLGQRRLLRPGGAAFAAPAAVAVDRQAGPQLPLHPLRHGRGRLLPGLLGRWRGRRRYRAGARARPARRARRDAGTARACARGCSAAAARVDSVAITQRGRASAVVAKAALVLASVSVRRGHCLRAGLRLSWRRTQKREFSVFTHVFRSVSVLF